MGLPQFVGAPGLRPTQPSPKSGLEDMYVITQFG